MGMLDINSAHKYKRWMAFDFGTLRIGIAVGQSLTKTATPIAPIKAKDGIPNWDNLEKIVTEWQPEAFLVGLPLNMDGSVSEMSRRALKFSRRIESRYRKPSYTYDERLSSYEAKGRVIKAGGNRNFKDNSVDGIAAQLILEGWLNSLPSPIL
jgi:putative Holliday junction resolvase